MSTTTVDQHLFDPGQVAAFPHATSIERSKAIRTVPLRFICLGPPRSGTVSLRQALIELGYTATYHYSTMLQENPSDSTLWLSALLGKFTPSPTNPPFTKPQRDALLGHCQATTDVPSIIFWQELLDMYPDAKVIVTLRDTPEQWVQSQMSTIIPSFENYVKGSEWDGDGVDNGMRVSMMMLRYSDMYSALWEDWCDGDLSGRRARAWYEGYVGEVKERVPGCLVFNVGEGWGPLCRFLGEEEREGPFSRRNDGGTFRRNVEDLDRLSAKGK